MGVKISSIDDLENPITDQNIIEYFYSKKNFKIKKFNYILLHKIDFPNIVKYLETRYVDSDSFLESIYRIKNHIDQKPICPICGNQIRFTHLTHRYFPKTCSLKCSRILASLNSEKSCLKKYNATNYTKTKEYKYKYKEYCLAKYGVDSYLKTEDFKDKSKSTCLKRYNVDYALKIKEIHDKGVEKSQSTNSILKRNNTILKKYGVVNISKNKDIKKKKEQTLLKHYGVKNTFEIPYVKEKCNSEESRKKMNETKHKNNSFNRSNSEDMAFMILKEKYNGIIRQYNSPKYPFNCDFYIPSLDLYIEYNEHWTHGNHPFDKNNYNDVEQLKKWKSKNTKYYKNAIYVWTDLDIRKRDIAIKNNIEYIEFWNMQELIKWVKYQELKK